MIDEIVASCNGDMRGAVKALLLVNEQLESELSHFHRPLACGSATNSSLHREQPPAPLIRPATTFLG